MVSAPSRKPATREYPSTLSRSGYCAPRRRHPHEQQLRSSTSAPSALAARYLQHSPVARLSVTVPKGRSRADCHNQQLPGRKRLRSLRKRGTSRRIRKRGTATTAIARWHAGGCSGAPASSHALVRHWRWHPVRRMAVPVVAAHQRLRHVARGDHCHLYASRCGVSSGGLTSGSSPGGSVGGCGSTGGAASSSCTGTTDSASSWLRSN